MKIQFQYRRSPLSASVCSRAHFVNVFCAEDYYHCITLSMCVCVCVCLLHVQCTVNIHVHKA